MTFTGKIISGTDVIAVVSADSVKIDACGQFTKARLKELSNVLHWDCYPCTIKTVQGQWVLHTEAGSFPFNHAFTLERGVHY